MGIHQTSPTFSIGLLLLMVMEDVKGAPAVHFNFPWQSFSLYITFKSWIAAASEVFLMHRVSLLLRRILNNETG